MESEMKKINVTISGTQIPLRVPEEEVEQMKDIVEEINRKVLEYQTTFNNKDIRECLSMALLTYAVDLNKFKSGHHSDSESSSPGLSRLDELLDQYIQTA